MLKVDIKSATPGMVLALPVRHPNTTERNLLNADFKLTRETLARLRSMNIREIWIRYPGLDELDRFIDPLVMERRSRIADDLKKTLAQVQSQSSARLPYERYMQQMAWLVEDLLKNRTAVLFMDEAGGADPSLLTHSSNVSFISILMGMKLDAYLIRQRKRLSPDQARKVGNLGVGAMLHDIGMLKLDEEVLHRRRQTRNDLDPAWQAHTRLGYELVHGQIEPSASVVVLDHHQRFDGSGFPATVSPDGSRSCRAGDHIHIFARICAVADTFDELRAPCDGDRIPTVAAIRRLLTLHKKGWFDPVAVQAFLQVVPPFAPGSTVLLSDGRYATPLEHTAEDPCRPRVQIIPDPSKMSRRDMDDFDTTFLPIIDLKLDPSRRIIRAEGFDVTPDLFPPPRIFANEVDRIRMAVI